MARSAVTARHLLALANPPEATELMLYLIRRASVSLDPSTQRPVFCGWSLDKLYSDCVAAARIDEQPSAPQAPDVG